MILKRTKIIPIKWINEQHDSDWDGVPNYRDCQPFNPRRQDDEKEKITMNESKRNPVPGYQFAQPIPAPAPAPTTVPEYQYPQPTPVPEYQYAQQYQIPPRMYDTDINLPAVRFKFIRYIL